MRGKRPIERQTVLGGLGGLFGVCCGVFFGGLLTLAILAHGEEHAQLRRLLFPDAARRLMHEIEATNTSAIVTIQAPYVDPVVALSAARRQMVGETLVVQNRPLMPSDRCKKNEGEILKLCSSINNIDGLCDARQSNLTSAEYNPLPAVTAAPRCKTLWFAGFHMGVESQCKGRGGGYRAEYAAALATQLMNAADTLQPVLVLAWQGVENSTDREFLTTWAERRGVIVINVDRFSFQDQLEERDRGRGGRNGAFIRLDIPSLIRRNGLFDLPNICQPEVLYTDSDVVFMNRVSSEDMQYVKQAVSKSAHAAVAYGPEAGFDADRMQNTGVMVMHVHRFQAEWPKMLEWAMAEPAFPGHDQALLNGYFEQEGKDLERKRATLPLAWNWKTYWPVPEGAWASVKVVHTHGPKPMRGLWNVAECKFARISAPTVAGPYRRLMQRGLCCNRGSVAARVSGVVNSVMQFETVCGLGDVESGDLE